MKLSPYKVQEVTKLAPKLPANKQSDPEVRFDKQTVIVTGSGAGLGRIYALMFANLGANVVINDVSEKAALGVVDEIKKVGKGSAIAVVGSAEEGERLVNEAIKAFGRVDALVANAGILRDKSFAGMSDAEWDAVVAVHLRGTYKVSFSRKPQQLSLTTCLVYKGCFPCLPEARLWPYCHYCLWCISPW